MKKDLSYISVYAREGILKTYRETYEIDSPDLEAKIFGYPSLREMVDEGIENANTEVDLERFNQWSEPWFKEVIKALPDPEHLDDYKNVVPAHLSEPPTVPIKKKPKDYIKTLKGYKQFRDKVDDIILNFDFAKVHQVMEELDWRWAAWVDENGDGHESEVPSVYALRERAHQMLLDAVEDGFGGCGGFEVSCYVYDLCDEDGVPYSPSDPDDFANSVCLSLQFVLTEYGRDY